MGALKLSIVAVQTRSFMMTDTEVLAREMATFDQHPKDPAAGLKIEMTNVAFMINSLANQAARIVSITLDAPRDADFEFAAESCKLHCVHFQAEYNNLEEDARSRGFQEEADIRTRLLMLRSNVENVATAVRIIAARYGVVPASD